MKGVGLPPTTMETTILVGTVDISTTSSGNSSSDSSRGNSGDSSSIAVAKCTENLQVVNVLDQDVSASFRLVSDDQSTSGTNFVILLTMNCSLKLS